MASGKVLKSTKYLAKLADTLAPCAFCQRMVDEETTYGKLYRIGDIYCHYFCVLLSCCLIQKGKDEDGLFGFLYHDILAEIERSNKHKCSYCYRVGATIGCSVPKCRKQFHLPCGREKQAISLFYGNYKTFCKQHAPKQKIPDIIMTKAKLRLSMEKKMKRQQTLQNIKKEENCCEIDTQQELQCICMICYEAVDGYPTTQTFWPPCCARDAWFHRSCLERMALSAGIHYLKCPLCNDKDHFYEAVVSQGYYIPDRDAAWELEQNAFADIYERPVVCTVEDCKCPMGREYDADSEAWSIELCVLCGGEGAHRACALGVRVCADCAPAAPDRHALASLAHVPLPSQNNNTQRQRSGPVMPSRMSLRRTKGRQKSSTPHIAIKKERNEDTNLTEKSRQELNIKSPKKRILEHSTLQNVEKKLLSPLKLLERDLYERILNADDFVLDKNVLDEVQDRFKRPKPLIEKKKIVNEILERFINNISKENIKTKEPIKEWNSPKKIYDKENVMEINTNEIDTKISNTLQEIKEEISTDTKEISENLDSKNMEVFREISMAKDLVAEDDDSNSTFQLPSEFIADYNSDQSLPIFDTPKKLKKVNIEKDSMEISKNDQIINIDLVKIENEGCLKNVLIPEKNEKSALKFSMFNNEVLEKNNMDIDIESFKNQYLNEVDRHFHCNFNHKHVQNEDLTTKLCTAIDFAMDSMKKPPKRKLPSSDGVATKRRKTTKMVENENVKKKRKIKKMKRKSKKNHNNKLSIQNRNINLKIKWKNEELKLKISKPKKKRKSKKNRPKVLRQYVLKFFEKDLQNASICRPDNDVVQLKTKKKRTIKKSDNLKQTSIDSFFKT